MFKKIKKVGYQFLQKNNKKFTQMKEGVYCNEKIFSCFRQIIGSSSNQISKKYLQFFSTKKQNNKICSLTDDKNVKQQKFDTKSTPQQQNDQSKKKKKNSLQKQQNNHFVKKQQKQRYNQGQKSAQKQRTNQKNQKKDKKDQKNKQEQKSSIFDMLIPMIGIPLIIYMNWDSHRQKKAANSFIKTKIELTDLQNRIEIENIDFQQIEKKLQRLFNSKKQNEIGHQIENINIQHIEKKLQELSNESNQKRESKIDYQDRYLSQWEKIKTIKVIINDQQKKKLIGLKKFILKKQNENYPILFIDFKNESKNYQLITDHVGLRQLYGPATSSDKVHIFRTVSFQHQFKSHLIVIVINFGQEMKIKKQNNSNVNVNVSQQKLINEKRRELFQKLQKMQTSYEWQRLKANIILVFNDQKDYEKIIKDRESSLYQVLK